MSTATAAVQTATERRPARNWLHLWGQGKHRCLMTKAELKAEVQRLDEENNNLVCAYIQTKADLRQTASQLGTAVVDNAELTLQVHAVEESTRWADDAMGQTIEVPAPMDIRQADDRPTMPAGTDVTEVREDFTDDYLDLRRQKWQPAPVGAALLAVEIGEPSADHRFPATARISA